jgi:hypothetical protein
MGVSAIFYPPGGESPWYLKGKSGKNYYLKTIKNIPSSYPPYPLTPPHTSAHSYFAFLHIDGNVEGS